MRVNMRSAGHHSEFSVDHLAVFPPSTELQAFGLAVDHRLLQFMDAF